MPGHFAERHGLILIIALGESIVAIGVGAEGGVDAGVVAAAVAGHGGGGRHVVALLRHRRPGGRAAAGATPTPGREQNEIARDSFSYLHFPMVAGIVLLALGLKKTLEHTDDPLKLVPAVALLGGVAMYLLAHVAFRWRNVHRFSVQRVVCAVVLVAFLPLAVEVDALVSVTFVAVALVVLIVYETVRFAELRDRLRHQIEAEPAPD